MVQIPKEQEGGGSSENSPPTLVVSSEVTIVNSFLSIGYIYKQARNPFSVLGGKGGVYSRLLYF